MNRPNLDNVRELDEKAEEKWPAIFEAERLSLEKMDALDTAITGLKLDKALSVVMYGSLPRLELTTGSDLDWALLVDGRADPGHTQILRDVSGTLEGAGLADPNKEGAFAQLCYSHNLVQQIGGNSDTNMNLTRRALLLLESWAPGGNDAYERTIRQLLRRYLEDNYTMRDGVYSCVPRYLLNDIARYWRTITVDYAMKRRDRPKWALRNVKLHFSRKLQFVSGMLVCLLAQVNEKQFHGVGFEKAALLNFLEGYSHRAPLDILAEALTTFRAEVHTEALLGPYNTFLEQINKPEIRDALKNLECPELGNNPHFSDLQELGRSFDKALKGFLFSSDETLKGLIIDYGII